MHMPFPQRELEHFSLAKVIIDFEEKNIELLQRENYTSKMENTLFFIFSLLRSF